MKASTFSRAVLLGVATLGAALILSACGAGAEPEDREFDLRIEERRLNLQPAVIKVNQGDGVTLNVDADEHGIFHLHGYDIEIDLSPEQTASMAFTANATGKFSITFHPGEEVQGEGGEHDEEGEEIPIASLEVQPG